MFKQLFYFNIAEISIQNIYTVKFLILYQRGAFFTVFHKWYRNISPQPLVDCPVKIWYLGDKGQRCKQCATTDNGTRQGKAICGNEPGQMA